MESYRRSNSFALSPCSPTRTMTVFLLPDLVLGPEEAQKVVDEHLSADGAVIRVVDVKEVPSSKLRFA